MGELRKVTIFKTNKGQLVKEIRGYQPSFKSSDSITYKGNDYFVQKISTDNRAPLPKKDGSGMVSIVETTVILIKKEDLDLKTKENLKRHLGEKKTYSIENIEKSTLALEKRLDMESKMPTIKPIKETQPKEEVVKAAKVPPTPPAAPDKEKQTEDKATVKPKKGSRLKKDKQLEEVGKDL